jgi:RNase H-fold protein (predicted Holliday junction resolvase)
MRARGQKPSRSKASVDSNAAAVLLQGALDFERRHQLWAGRPLEA